MSSDFATLGLPDGASLEQAKSAWRALARRLHPDRCDNDPAASARMAEINAAWDRIRNGNSHQAGRKTSAQPQATADKAKGWQVTPDCHAAMASALFKSLCQAVEAHGLPDLSRMAGIHIAERFEIRGGAIHIFFCTQARQGRNIIAFPSISFTAGMLERARIHPTKILIREVHLPEGGRTRKATYGTLKTPGHPETPVHVYFLPGAGSYASSFHRKVSDKLENVKFRGRRAPAESPLRSLGKMIRRAGRKLRGPMSRPRA